MKKKITKTYDFKLDSQPVYDKKHIKSKLKTYDGKFNTVSENSKRKNSLLLHYSNLYWFYVKIKRRKLSSNVIKTM